MKKKIKSSQLIFNIIAIMIVSSLFIVGALSLKVVWKMTAKNFRSSTEQVAYSARTMIDNRMNLYKDKVQAFIDETNFTDLNDVHEKLVLLSKEDKTILNMYYVDNVTDGFSQVADEEVDTLAVKNRSWYKTTVNGRGEFVRIAPYTDMLTDKNVKTISKAIVKDGQVIGYTIKTSSKGYGGAIELMVGISKDSKITGVEIGNHSETPGLGSKATEPMFKNQYVDKDVSNSLLVVKGSANNDNEISAISGATITSNGVTSGVNAAMKIYNEKLSGNDN